MDKNHLLLLLINLGFAFYFLLSYFFPRETGFWLIFQGSSVIIIEFYILVGTVGIVFLLPFLQGKLHPELGKVNLKQWPPFEKDPKLFACVIFSLAYIAFQISTVIGFGYLPYVALLLFTNFYSFMISSDRTKEVGAQLFSLLSLAVSWFVAGGLFLLTESIFPVQTQILSSLQYGKNDQFIGSDPLLLAFWGFLHFVAVAVLIQRRRPDSKKVEIIVNVKA
jgi:hypothetical protein